MKLSDIINSEYVKNEYSKGKCYLLRGRSVYQLHWSGVQKHMTAMKLYTKSRGGVPLTYPGHINMSGDGAWVNRVIGYDLLTDTNFELQ